MNTHNLASSRYIAAVSLLALAGCELITAPDHDLITGQGGSTTSTTGGGGQGGSTTTTTGGGGSGGGTGGGPECTDASTCPVATKECQDAACDNAGMCGFTNKTEGTACTEDGGIKCATNGDCVECLLPADCPVSGSACNAGVCVSPLCMNSTKDVGNEETDVDCGGTICPKCTNTKTCAAGTDCTSGFCNGSNVCAGCAADGDCASGNYCLNPGATTGVCTPKQGDGTVCTAANQCTNPNCIPVSGGGSVCCDTSCNNGCKTCDAAFNGGMSGKCLSVTAGQDPKNNCDNTCSSGCDGAMSPVCVATNNGGNCGSGPTCTAGMADPQDTCGSATCNAGTSMSCGIYTCNAGNTACLTMCAAQGDCVTGNYCAVTGTTEADTQCHAKKATSAACLDTVECVTGDYCAITGTTEADTLCHARKAMGVACLLADECTNGMCTANVCN